MENYDEATELEPLSHEEIVKFFCSGCWLYTDKNEKNPQEVIDCENCYKALRNEEPIERILKRYSKNPKVRSNEVTVWDQIFRPPRKFRFGVNEIDYAIYAKLREKIER